MKNLTLFVYSLFVLAKPLIAQESINSTGQSVNYSEYSMDYSIGQLVFSAVKNESYSLHEGVIQIYEVQNDILGSKNNIQISIFPNPSKDHLTIKSNDINLEFALYSINGKVQTKGKTNSKEFSINIRELPSSTYLLRITDKNQKTRTFKILKN